MVFRSTQRQTKDLFTDLGLWSFADVGAGDPGGLWIWRFVQIWGLVICGSGDFTMWVDVWVSGKSVKEEWEGQGL